MSEWGNKDFANNEPQYLQTNHPGNTNVYLVDSSRLANATFGGGKAVAHQGWVKVNPGSGFITNVAVSNVSSSFVYANAYCSVVGANTTPANLQVIVIGTNNVSVVLHNTGLGYTAIPTITAAGANNANLIFTVTETGGRLGRVQSETLVAMSDPQVSDANSGLPYFPGV